MMREPTCQELTQGTPEWLALRKTKVTATDAAVIMGASPWKTRLQLYNEKLSPTEQLTINERMQRGLDLEPIARALFTIYTGVDVKPRVVIKDWAMASLDGISDNGRVVVEIKCPGERDHMTALEGKVPDHYYPQLQHQMWICDVDAMCYFSFDGQDGVTVTVKRDPFYIEKMIEEEKKFYDCLMNKTPPESSSKDYVERDDDIWNQCASNWISITSQIKQLESMEEELRKQLIFLSGESNARGGGVSLCHVQRKGNVDYSRIPQLKGVDLEMYRKGPTNSWRVSCQ